jgi:hypothetical protein
MTTTPPKIQIQTVLYKTDRGSVDRLFASVARTGELAKLSGVVRSVALAVGDCSPLPVLRAVDVPELTSSLGQAGIDFFRYDFFDRNLGSAAGHNRLLPTWDTDLVLTLNPDVVVSPYLIEELILRLDDAKVGVVEGRQLPLEHAKAYDPTTGETSWASTACALVPRTVFQEVGDFDSSSFFLYCDDVDFSWRVRLAGYKVVFHPPARIFHDKRIDSRGRMEVGDAEEYYAAEAALMMVHKWSRPDLVTKYLTGLRANGSPRERDAAEAFVRRRRTGDLPEPLDPMHRVGQFHGFNWARHRW